MSYLVIDAAYPPAVCTPSVEGVMGYIGGAADHVWTPAEWGPFASVRQFPVWVPRNEAPASEAAQAVAEMRRLGWAAREADTRVVVCDMETAVMPSWYAVWAAAVAGAGYVSVCYGSMSTVFGNEAADVIAADWDGIDVIPAGQTLHGVQFRANVPLGGATVDFDVFDSWLMARGGVGPRKGA